MTPATNMHPPRRRIALAAVAIVLALPLAAQRSGPGPTVTSIQLKITDARGGPLQTARVQLLGFMPGGKTFRRVPDQAPRELTPKDFPGDYATLADLPAGEFVLRIDVDQFATTLSEPFTIPSNALARLGVKVETGATIEGTVRAPDGKPLADVEVSNEDAALPDPSNPLAQLLAGMLAERMTPAHVRTDAQGNYRISHVAKGACRIVANHADFAPDHRDVKVDGNGRVAVPPMTLATGALFVGIVTRDGKPVAGAEVVLQSLAKGKFPGSEVDRVDLLGKAVSDAKGHFRMPTRVPYGTDYELMASEGGAPLQRAGDLAGSRRKVTPQKGLAEQVEVVAMPKR